MRSFETRHRVQLPEDYRRFLSDLGNGGAGPFYGIFKLGEMDDGYTFKRWEEGGGFVGILSAPFPHVEPWNDVPSEPEKSDDEDAYWAAVDAVDERYWNSQQVNGAIPICHEGCALRDWLVITGPEAGHVWHDARVDHEGLHPVQIGSRFRVTFLDWYMDWLNGALAAL